MFKEADLKSWKEKYSSRRCIICLTEIRESMGSVLASGLFDRASNLPEICGKCVLMYIFGTDEGNIRFTDHVNLVNHRCISLSNFMAIDDQSILAATKIAPSQREESVRMSEFESGLEDLINVYSMENNSNTPDFILAQYLRQCLEAFNLAVNSRSNWYGRSDVPGQ